MRALQAQIKRSQPDVIFLCETKASEERMDQVMHSVGFSNKVVVNAKGTTGGLCLMWKSSLSVDLVDFNNDIIAIKISDVVCEWILVGFYGPSYAAKKKKAWENLSALLESFKIPWVCLGDFNFTTRSEEHTSELQSP